MPAQDPVGQNSETRSSRILQVGDQQKKKKKKKRVSVSCSVFLLLLTRPAILSRLSSMFRSCGRSLQHVRRIGRFPPFMADSLDPARNLRWFFREFDRMLPSAFRMPIVSELGRSPGSFPMAPSASPGMRGPLAEAEGGLPAQTEQQQQQLQQQQQHQQEGWLSPFSTFLTPQAWSPFCDVRETDKEIIVEVEVPGVKKEDIRVSLEDDVLIIAGETKKEVSDKREKVHRVERTYGSFTRSLQLPEGLIEKEQIRCKYDNGICRITIPKRPESAQPEKQAHVIDVE